MRGQVKTSPESPSGTRRTQRCRGFSRKVLPRGRVPTDPDQTVSLEPPLTGRGTGPESTRPWKPTHPTLVATSGRGRV